MADNESREPDDAQKSDPFSASSSASNSENNPPTPNTAPKVPDSISQNSGTHQSGSPRSSSSGKRKSRHGKKRNAHPSYRVSLLTRIKTPMLQCRRCGERYRVSWSNNTRCPKCGRHPAKIQPWQSALYVLFFPAAILGSIIQFQRSPRNAAIIFGMGIAGLLVETAIYFIAK